ncbi:MAG: undecaprenyl/decaprenyl-phosphate alpha-N-acetylglucosaminyl 1-phosphate transferase [Candidatus Syntrophonatronum acetioxidans]|uniref:Undecaprenyl/decaprenyl-phosphate alpha-N-acetylglucosaminyl 1-phosphate transferase n=1 Tax=Candidatus Syntrophonatronum acetioxidans TaxID=1795816 RepID=A0A424YG97_9FIRM|nr:MAG: undecaprenyl/decaprenyl-phosphate alpha-N-acetylglucosaminyl 1-phosphate transferase [Candidatus Syntrophonatronum acetioxidans]
MVYLYTFFLSMLVTLLATPLVIKLAYRVGALDQPDNRKVHRKIMPRLGGGAIYIGFIISLIFFMDFNLQVLGIILGGTLILILGAVDDIWGIPPLLKLKGQVVAALVVAAFGVRVNFLSNPFDGFIELGLLTIPFTVLWIVAITNAVNLIDGLDGLASGISTIALATFAVISFFMGQPLVSLMALALVGSVLAFLKYNFFPARVFLGDSGSLFLGFNVASLAVFGLLKGVTMVAFVIPIIVLGVPLFDTLFAVVRRYLQREPIFQADKEHIHHRLLKKGFSHRQVVVLIYLISLCFSASALLMFKNLSILP